MMDRELLTGVGFGLCIIAIATTIALLIPKNHKEVVWCQTIGGVPVTDNGVLRACLKPEAVFKEPDNEN